MFFPILHFGRHANEGAIAPTTPPPWLRYCLYLCDLGTEAKPSFLYGFAPNRCVATWILKTFANQQIMRKFCGYRIIDNLLLKNPYQYSSDRPILVKTWCLKVLQYYTLFERRLQYHVLPCIFFKEYYRPIVTLRNLTVGELKFCIC